MENENNLKKQEEKKENDQEENDQDETIFDKLKVSENTFESSACYDIVKKSPEEWLYKYSANYIVTLKDKTVTLYNNKLESLTSKKVDNISYIDYIEETKDGVNIGVVVDSEEVSWKKLIYTNDGNIKMMDIEN